MSSIFSWQVHITNCFPAGNVGNSELQVPKFWTVLHVWNLNSGILVYSQNTLVYYLLEWCDGTHLDDSMLYLRPEVDQTFHPPSTFSQRLGGAAVAEVVRTRIHSNRKVSDRLSAFGSFLSADSRLPWQHTERVQRQWAPNLSLSRTNIKSVFHTKQIPRDFAASPCSSTQLNLPPTYLACFTDYSKIPGMCKSVIKLKYWRQLVKQFVSRSGFWHDKGTFQSSRINKYFSYTVCKAILFISIDGLLNINDGDRIRHGNNGIWCSPSRLVFRMHNFSLVWSLAMNVWLRGISENRSDCHLGM